MSSILIVEDEGIIRSALKRLLERNQYQVYEAGSVAEAREVLSEQQVNLIISDLRLPGEVGTELINPSIPVLIMTSYASLKSAVDAMKLGAVEYIAKPFNHDEMLVAVKEILKKQRNQVLQQLDPWANTTEASVSIESSAGFFGLIGESPVMQEVFSQIKKIAPFNTRVLILGQSGTGKELVAKALHSLSPRNNEPFIPVNCAAIPETLIESELFGFEKGAFTGATASRSGLVEAADGGTLFLDEIGELPLEAQARLLRVLQENEIRRLGSIETKKVDVRLIAATHRDLEQMIEQGKFRQDLYYRLNVIELELPSLIERGEDLLIIASSLLVAASERLERPNMKFSKAAQEALFGYSWPGNVRELENKIERAVILAETNSIKAKDLGLNSAKKSKAAASLPSFDLSKYQQLAENSPSKPAAPTVSNSNMSLEDYFVRFVLENEEQMSETQLAKKLGISRKSLWERRQKLGIPRKR